MSDLVAEFLAREQEELGDIDDFQFDDVHQDTMNNHQEYRNDEFNMDAQVYNDFLEDDRTMDRHDDFYSQNTVPVVPRIEAEKIRAWKIEFESRIEAKDAEEVRRKAQQETEAKKELEDWNAHHKEQLANKRKLNKDSQSAFVKERDQPLPGSEWHRVCKMCDFGSRPVAAIVVGAKGGGLLAGAVNGAMVGSAGAGPMSKDTGRMKSILLSLKSEPLVRQGQM